MPEIAPRKLPRQARSQATFEAILEACARLLRERPLREITTNHIARRAGVSIGTLYEFFPNRDAVLAVLLERRLAGLLARVRRGVAEALELDPRALVDRLVRQLVAAVTAERDLFRVLLREAPALGELEAVRRARAAFFELAPLRGRRAGGGRAKLPHPEVDDWLIRRMLANAVLEIAFLEDDDAASRRELAVRELVLLVHRMVYASD